MSSIFVGAKYRKALAPMTIFTLNSKQELKLQFLWWQRGVECNFTLCTWHVASAEFDLASPILTRMWLRIGSLKKSDSRTCRLH